MTGILGRWRRALFPPRHEPAPDVAPLVRAATVPVLAMGEAPATQHGIPPAAVEMVAHFESFRADAYICPAGKLTIGYGTTRIDGKPVRVGMRISEAKAREFLAADLADAAQAVDALVDVPLTANEFGALVSFVHNVGRGNFSTSTLLRRLNAGKKDAAASEFGRWNRGGGVVLPGLIRRRAAEAAMFGGGNWRAAARIPT